MAKQLTIVVKLGSSSIVDEATKEPRIANMSLVVETLVKLKRQGHHIIIVSSGAIAVGLRTMKIHSKPKQLAKIQALASIGQGRLIALWDNLFGQLDQTIGQVLLTKNDIVHWSQFQNARSTMNELLEMGVIPIVNENDTLSVREIRFGDNDTLSAITAAMVDADYLFLLTDVDCLYTENPREHPEAKPILQVTDMLELHVDTSSGGSDIGTGGMTTKIIAAEIASSVGITTVIAKSSVPGNIPEILDYLTGASDVHPLHTSFVGQEKHVNNRKFWLLHGLKTYGTLIIDEGAAKALTRKNRAGLLPAGILEVQGNFHESQCVTLKVGTKTENGSVDNTKPIVEIGRARVNYTSAEIQKIKGCHSHKIEEILGYSDTEYIAHRENLAFTSA